MTNQQKSATRMGQQVDSPACRSSSPAKVSRKNTPMIPDDAAAVQSARKEEEEMERKRDAVRQAIFQEASDEALEIPLGYLNVAVKIIRWDESIDDFKGHTEEIERLQSIFVNLFGYECSVHSIEDSKRPQLDINKAILDHVHKHDDPNNLLIIYYTGHGSRNEEGEYLELSAKADPSYIRASRRHMAKASWRKAELPVLNDMEGDALVILDCCMASAAALKCRNVGSRIYQLLAASAEESFTTGPGPNSFTTALCNSLEELLDEKGGPFLLTQLCEKINEKRKRQPCIPWDRLRSYKRTVQLGPLHQHQTQEREAAFQKDAPERASINLRLSLKVEDLNDEQIKHVARQIPHICREAKVDVRRIYWEGMTTKKRAMSSIIEADSDDGYEVTINNQGEDTIGRTRPMVFEAAVHSVNRAYKVRNAFRRMHDNRRPTCESENGAFQLFARTLMTGSMALAFALVGALVFTETKERCILFGAGVAMVVAYQMQQLEQTLQGDRRRRGLR
ncbi:unnamed protein product [Alternaria alternata]|uniref:Peptidase C14 caspase domain-containing protein n=1 Tax=Alternaria alternata TaxID=5599 RepID=A0A4Q4NVQ4_ALTAL|nr:hypothetical protein AALT_g4986 [Alternaria alternata]RYN83304.1 hypothetical protein AA0117_g574 [Alternaria alternata]